MKESLDISKDNLQDAAKSYNNCNEPNMKEILLIKKVLIRFLFK